MKATDFNSILQDLFLDPWRDAVSVRGSSDPQISPEVGNAWNPLAALDSSAARIPQREQ
jgi:hypothetical protein